MVKKLLRNIIIGILAFAVGIFFIDGVGFAPELIIEEQMKTLFLAGSLLGVINTILLPIVNLIFLPIRIITLGIFNIVTSIAMVVIVSLHFQEITIAGFREFFLLTFVVWILTFITAANDRKKD